MKTFNSTLVGYFNVALVSNNKLSFADVNNFAMQRGYIVHPDACCQKVMDFLKTISINPNATFYKEWNDILSKNRFELFIDQICHYISTYGTNFTEGNGYVPNTGAENVPEINFSEYKVIGVISEEDLFKRCDDVLCAGVALKQNTMEALADYIIEYVQTNNIAYSVDAIKNREALVYLCAKLNIYPNDKFALLRYIIYVTTGDTMIIKNNLMISKIKNSYKPFNFSKLNDKQLIALSSIFLRFKDLFLAFKHNDAIDNKSIINTLRRLAKSNHTPMVQKFWDTVWSSPKTFAELVAHADELTNFKKVSLMEAALFRMKKINSQFYIVRNQKGFLRENYAMNTNDEYNTHVYAALYMSLINSMRGHSTKEVVDKDGNIVSVPKVVRVLNCGTIALPSSEKSFIGNYPYGTSYNMEENNYIGCYWRNEWGTYDYDLHYLDISGNSVGWCYSFNKNNDIIFSGDMTSADPEAAEVMYMKKGGVPSIIYVNQYNGESKSKFRMFFGSENLSQFDTTSGYMVDPNTIKFNVDIEHENCREIGIGVCNGSKFVFMPVTMGNHRVATNNKYTQKIIEILLAKSECFVNAAEALKDAGYTIVDSNYTGDVDIDFANLDKDSFIAAMQ